MSGNIPAEQSFVFCVHGAGESNSNSNSNNAVRFLESKQFCSVVLYLGVKMTKSMKKIKKNGVAFYPSRMQAAAVLLSAVLRLLLVERLVCCSLLQWISPGMTAKCQNSDYI